MIKKLNLKFYNILFILIPLSIILGPTISLINIFLLILVYFILHFKGDHFQFIFKNKTLIFLLLLNIYLIFNTLISVDPSSGIFRNIGFIRLILLFISINYLFYINKYDFSSFKIWSIFFILFVFDVYFERFYGTNILGFGSMDQEYGPRVVSFFKDEPIAGAYILGLLFLIVGYLLEIYKNKSGSIKIIPLVLLLFFLVSILITGERSNTIKAFAGFFLLLLFLDYLKIKFRILFLLSFLTIFLVTVYQSDYLKIRYVNQLYNLFFKSDYQAKQSFKLNQYLKIYKSGISVFKRNPVLGVGNKNYRIETCHKDRHNKYNYHCTTHPHQIYIEFLSEHGIVGSLISLSIFFFIIFRILRPIIENKNYIQIGAFIFVLVNFLPLIPSGAFFSDFNITFFMLNLSLMYAVSNKTNIFERNKFKGR